MIVTRNKSLSKQFQVNFEAIANPPSFTLNSVENSINKCQKLVITDIDELKVKL